MLLNPSKCAMENLSPEQYKQHEQIENNISCEFIVKLGNSICQYSPPTFDNIQLKLNFHNCEFSNPHKVSNFPLISAICIYIKTSSNSRLSLSAVLSTRSKSYLSQLQSNYALPIFGYSKRRNCE